ncbi:MAG: glycosyltransferase family 4 protein [Gemmatimonadales bacterium]
MGRRLSICYIVPGHNLLATAGPTRHVLSLAGALGELAETTVAFRRVLEPVAGGNFSILEIEPGACRTKTAVDDAAVRGVGYREFAQYLVALRRFCDQRLTGFDIVLEKSWLLSGLVTAWCLDRGIPSLPVLNVVPVAGAWSAPTKAARNLVGRYISGRYLRRAPRIIAESPSLKTAIAGLWGIRPERIEVLGLGIDRAVFRPMDQTAARRELGIPPDETVLLYVGALDRAHDITAVIEGVIRVGDPSIRLRVVGDGEFRPQLEARAGGSGAVTFHGRVPHGSVPGYIAAADLCLAPYDPRHFPGGQVGYATLKVREYLAAGRAVATAPSGLLPDLIRQGESGFRLENTPDAWAHFLENELPSRARLLEMGQAAARIPLPTWEDTAAAYLALCERACRRGNAVQAPRRR